MIGNDTSEAQLILLSDFNIDLFARYLKNSAGTPRFEVMPTAYGQIFQSLYSPPPPKTDIDRFAVIWSRPQSVIESFGRLLTGLPVDPATIDKEIDAFVDAIRSYSAYCTATFIVSWVKNPGDHDLGLQEWNSTTGPSYNIARMNLRIAEAIENIPSVFLLDPSRWMTSFKPSSVRDKLWYTMKVPFENSVFENAAAAIRASVDSLSGRSKKLIVLDLDHTLWGGVVGDDGVENLELGGHSWRGEAFVAFQRELLALSRRGVQLAIVSKNEEETALKAIDSHPEMLLRLRDFAGWKINWQDKAQNILSLTTELNLGLNSVVFIDDNPSEQRRVSEALPEVLVPDWPSDPASFVTALHSLTCFGSVQTTEEDQQRTAMYVAERQRKESAKLIKTMDEWLLDLRLSLEVHALNEADKPRILQLLNKTNQMNLSTRRLSEKQLLDWLAPSSRDLISIRVSDRFGEYGLTAIIGFELSNEICTVIDFVMSCRVMGRKVEEGLLHIASRFAIAHEKSLLQFIYLATDRNKPTQRMLEDSSLKKQDENCYTWSLEREYMLPSHIEINSTLAWLGHSKKTG